MALKLTPDNLRDEVQAAAEVRDKHLSQVDDLIKYYHGSYWRTDHMPPRAVVENHAYEFLSIMVPGVVYDDPRVKVRSADPNQTDAYGMTTMGQRASKLEASLNRWATNDELGSVLVDGLIDFYFCWCVWKVTMADHPGWQGYDNAPQKPLLLQIDQRDFVMDAAAKHNDPMRLNGPRFMGEKWKADREALLDDPYFDEAQVLKMSSDMEVDEYDPERGQGTDLPSRDEVVCWDIWVPEKDVRMDQEYVDRATSVGMEPVPPDAPGYNGTIYTIAANQTNDGVGKKTYFIRQPEPAFCPPWGPYVVSGYMKVPRSPFPLSPLVATAEQAEEVNAHRVAAAEDAAQYKRFGVYNSTSQADGQRIKKVRHGGVVGLDDTEGFDTHELGGVSDAQYKYNQFARDSLNRTSGVSESQRGESDDDATATAESIAQQGAQTRTEGIKMAYRRGVTRVFKTAAWYAHHAEGFRMVIGDQGDGDPEFFGGVSAEQGTMAFDFFDLTLSLEPYSMGHTDQVLLQRRMQDAWSKVIESAPLMGQTPYIKWGEAIKAFMEVLNIEDAEEWIDAHALAVAQQMQSQQVTGMAQQGAGGGEPGAGQGQVVQPDPAIQPAQQTAQMMGAMQGAARGGGF